MGCGPWGVTTLGGFIPPGGGRESPVFAISPVRPPYLTEASVAGWNDIVCTRSPRNGVTSLVGAPHTPRYPSDVTLVEGWYGGTLAPVTGGGAVLTAPRRWAPGYMQR